LLAVDLDVQIFHFQQMHQPTLPSRLIEISF